jgi:hypothetical protein
MPVLLLLTFVTGMLAAPKPVDFLREVRPILSDACFQCHGPDETTRMAKLRLDQKESAVPKASMILERVTETRGPRKMPPRHAKVQLSESQVATLKRWVQEGAPWQEHWSYVAPKKLAPPSSAAKKWAKGAARAGQACALRGSGPDDSAAAFESGSYRSTADAGGVGCVFDGPFAAGL